MRYELTDNEWTAIRPMLPNKPRGVPRVNDRRVLNGIFWVLRSGEPWRDLPENFGPYTTRYNRFVRWRRAGVWARIMSALAGAHDAAVQMIDTSIVRVHQHGACITRNRRQFMGRSRGGLTSKIHALVDTNGLPVRLALTAGEAHDNRLAGKLLSRLKSGTMLLADVRSDPTRGDDVSRGRSVATADRAVSVQGHTSSIWRMELLKNHRLQKKILAALLPLGNLVSSALALSRRAPQPVPNHRGATMSKFNRDAAESRTPSLAGAHLFALMVIGLAVLGFLDQPGNQQRVAQKLDPAACDAWDQEAVAGIRSLVSIKSASADLKLDEALAQLRRARAYCKAGSIAVARNDYEALHNALPVLTGSIRAPETSALTLSPTKASLSK